MFWLSKTNPFWLLPIWSRTGPGQVAYILRLEVKSDIKESNSSFWRYILEVTSDVRSALCHLKWQVILPVKTTWSFYNGTLYIVISFLTKEFMNSCVSFSVSVLFFTQRKWVTDIVKELLARKEIISNKLRVTKKKWNVNRPWNMQRAQLLVHVFILACWVCQSSQLIVWG